ncbi:hypothetical protein [Mucilaginibacter ginsenosidivorans]|uniref:DUF4252 domain-containing protein n=1 Tax=Mucilaginibacter ginsenosidivorans TaxID=398053 RepID=A0A5B8UT65_9SPHI|nr:hypothetical protein [Mucilaginibacter ginsenosidivorans]QEC62179.1 hypothetical protein FRZ54_06135 [Mucilaginibacter ginsenosidivorans]
MKLIASIILFAVIWNCGGAQNKTPMRDSVFLTQNDIKILLNSRNITYHHLDGSPVSDSSKQAGATYIMNYLSASKEKIAKEKYYKLISVLLNCNNLQPEANRCTILSSYCLQIKYKKEELLLFFSKPGVCGNTVEVIKVTGAGKNQFVQNYKAENLKVLD